jgi:hypothetical protein
MKAVKISQAAKRHLLFILAVLVAAAFICPELLADTAPNLQQIRCLAPPAYLAGIHWGCWS